MLRSRCDKKLPANAFVFDYFLDNTSYSPAGTITNATLDGGNYSNHGYALAGTTPAGAVDVLSDGDATHFVDFYYSLGLGDVYYSTIPLDFYLGGSGTNPPADSFRNIYAVNEAAFQAQLRRDNNTNNVPEPASIVLLGLGLLGLAARRRKIAA